MKRCRSTSGLLTAAALGFLLSAWQQAFAQVQAWEGSVTLPTYEWEADVNPKFWALEQNTRGSIVYPYTLQDHLSRTKANRTYKALFLENEYLKVTCLPELGGRIHSVLDKTAGREMFYLNRVIKPSMIAMRGAWISGGVEWNAGPQGHTVTCVSPVSALTGRNADSSAYLEIGNLEQSQRTRWTVRVTLHPGKAYLDERIRLFNPTDALSPYYFWNCTAFPCRSGTRFIFPMTLGTDHAGTKLFSWPIHEGQDLSRLKNYERSTSIFAVRCSFDFFGAYDVDLDRGIVQAADHAELSGKKAWTWGTWEFGLVSQKNLTDQDGPYIEVQSGPLPTQADYGALWPRDEVSWQEWWYPVHGLGDGFEYATKDVAVQTAREGDRLELRILATGRFPGVTCTISGDSGDLLSEHVDLSPVDPQTLALSPLPQGPVTIDIRAATGRVLASFVSPLPIPDVSPPTRPPWRKKADAELSTEELYLKGRWTDLATDRSEARRYYEEALRKDAGHAATLRALAILDTEAGLYVDAQRRLEQALLRDPTDGLSWYFLGVTHLRTAGEKEALRCAQRAAKCRETVSLGYDLAGRAHMRLGEYSKARRALANAAAANLSDPKPRNHALLAQYAVGDTAGAWQQAAQLSRERPTDLIPRAVLALRDPSAMERFVARTRGFVGALDFEMIATSLVFAEVGLFEEAARLLSEVCVKPVAEPQRDPLTLYYLAWFSTSHGDAAKAREYLTQAGRINKDLVFPSRPEAVAVLKHAIEAVPGDAQAHLHLGNLYAHLGRLDEAVSHWSKAARLNSSLAMAFRNLGLYAQVIERDLTRAAELYRKAVAARPTDQTLHRDLAKILAADDKHDAAIELLESVPREPMRRADVILTLAELYVDTERFAEVIGLLESTSYFVNREGGSLPWVLFNRAHVGQGRQRLRTNEPEAALRNFETALTYPENLGVGRSPEHERAAAHYWRGKTLAALKRLDEARAAWQSGAAEHEGSEDQNRYREMCRAALAREE